MVFAGRGAHIIIALILALLASAAQYFLVFRTLDLAIYDASHRFSKFSAAEDIIIIDIDERSMAKLGAWPWSRSRHAELLESVTRLGIKDIAFDVIFSELNAADIDGDVAFAEAIEQHGGVVLPIFIGQRQRLGYPLEIPPASLFYSANPKLGHIHIECDIDAICRSVYLKEGVGKAFWPHISLALLQQQRYLKKLPGSVSQEIENYSPKLIYRNHHNYISFPYRDHDFNTVSYVDVISDYFMDNKFAGYTAFVGSTAAGNSDIIATPSGKLPGVVANAIIYQQLREGSLVEEISPLRSALLVGLLGFVVLVLLSRLSPLLFLLGTLLTVAVSYVLMVFLLFQLQIWLPVASFMILIFSYYPLWNWFKLQLALNFLKRQLGKLNLENRSTAIYFSDGLQSDIATARPSLGVEVVTSTLRQLHAVNSVLDEQHFMIENTLARLEEAVLLFNTDGDIVFVNEAAKLQFKITAKGHIDDVSRQLVIVSERTYKNLTEFTEAIRTGERSQGIEFELKTSGGVEDSDEIKTTLFCRGGYLSFEKSLGESIRLLMLNFADISSLKSAERSKLDTLNFLSHDLRAPMVSILALVDNIRSGRNDEPIENNLDKIREYAQSNLNYSESILQLSKAESVSRDDFDLVDLHSIVDSAYCEVLDFAKSHKMEIKLNRDDDDMWVYGNTELLERAVQNLLSNAVKYGNPPGHIQLSLLAIAGKAQISVRDSGVGIDKAELDLIFQRYKRGKSRHGHLGAGLGLYFVSTVMKKHRGNIEVESELGNGTCFTLSLSLTEAGE